MSRYACATKPEALSANSARSCLSAGLERGQCRLGRNEIPIFKSNQLGQVQAVGADRPAERGTRRDCSKPQPFRKFSLSLSRSLLRFFPTRRTKNTRKKSRTYAPDQYVFFFLFLFLSLSLSPSSFPCPQGEKHKNRNHEPTRPTSICFVLSVRMGKAQE